MKSIKTIILAITAIVTFFVAVPSVSAQTLSSEQRQAAVTALQAQLPADLDGGMRWTKVELSPAGDLLTIVLFINPKSMGLTLDEIKKELSNMTESQVKEMFGEIYEMVTLFGCDIDIIMEFTDNTSKKYHFAR